MINHPEYRSDRSFTRNQYAILLGDWRIWPASPPLLPREAQALACWRKKENLEVIIHFKKPHLGQLS